MFATRRPGRYTIAELGDLFIAHAREVRGLKEGTTLTDYPSHVRVHLAPFFGTSPSSGSTPGASRRLSLS